MRNKQANSMSRPTIDPPTSNSRDNSIKQTTQVLMPIRSKDMLINGQSSIIATLKSFTPHTSNNGLYEWFFQGQLGNPSQYSPQKIKWFMQKYQPYDPRLISSRSSRFQMLQLELDKFFVGQVFNGKCHGVGMNSSDTGIVIFRDGRSYEGLLQNNIRQGTGLFVNSDHSWYYGEYSNNKKEGFGTEFTHKYSYQGTFVNGLKHGDGVLVDGNIAYVGKWEMDAIHGQGTLQTVQSKYSGRFQNFRKQGLGHEIFTNGDEYHGEYYEGKPHGNGQYHWKKQQCHFIGVFVNGQRCGKGQWKNSHGDRYTGHYRNDLKQGYGQFCWKSGNIYKGNFKNDLRHGYGEIYWYDGCVYKGEWQKGVQHGKGNMYYSGHQSIVAIFDNNVIVQVISNATDHPKKYKHSIKRSDRSKSYQKKTFKKEWKRVGSSEGNFTRKSFINPRGFNNHTDVLIDQQGIIPEMAQSSLILPKYKSKSKSPQHKHEVSPGSRHRLCKACEFKQHLSALDVHETHVQQSKEKINSSNKHHNAAAINCNKSKNALKFYMRHQAAQYLKFKF